MVRGQEREQESGWVKKQEVKKKEKQKDLGLDAWNLIFSPNIYGSLEQLLPNHWKDCDKSMHWNIIQQ